VKSQLTFVTLLVAICSVGAWMLAADARAPRAAHDSHDAPASADAALNVARQCLTTGDIAPLLRLVPADDRASVQSLFARVQRLRQRTDPEVRDFAETSFLQYLAQLASGHPTTATPPTAVAMNAGSRYRR